MQKNGAQNNSLVKILGMVKHQSLLIGTAILCTLTAAASGILYPYLTRLLIEKMGNGALPWREVIQLTGVLLGGAVFSAINILVLRKIGEMVVRELRIRLMDAHLHAPAALVEQRQAAESANRIISDTRIIGRFAADQIAGAVGSVLTLLFSIGLLLAIDVILSAVLLSCVLVSFFAIFPIAARLSGISKSIQECEAKTMGRVAEALLNIRLIKASTAEKEEKELFSRAAGSLYHENMRETKVIAWLSPIADTAISVSLILVLTIGAYRMSTGALGIASLVAFILYLFNVVFPITQLSIFSAEYHKASGASSRLMEALEMDREAYSLGAPLNGLQGALSIRELSFCYPGGSSPVLSIDALTLEAGSIAALVGLSGAGKSSLLALVSRLYESEGIFLDGRDINDLSLTDWRHHCAYVHQNTPVLTGSVYFNLCYGLDPKPSRDDCEQVLRKVRLWDILEAKDGIDTLISEQGSNISGGQRQRLAVARAILRKPDILLLDEATSALDSQTERDIQHVLDPLMKHCTTLIAAHRLNTVLKADTIVLLHEGRIAARGSHFQLLQSSPEYELLVREQLLSAHHRESTAEMHESSTEQS